MSDLGAGKEVLSYCNKCKATLAHTIVVMKDSLNIGKVECKTCGSVHAYKDPSKVRAKKTKASSKRVKKAASNKDSISDLWLEAVNNAKSKSRDYSIKTEFAVGDILDHPKFGPGVVDRKIDGDKIEVIFRHEIKTLIHNK